MNTIVCRTFVSVPFRCRCRPRAGGLREGYGGRPAKLSELAVDTQVTEAVTRALQAVRTSGSDFIVNDNIASSFRSLYKLGFLYSEFEIDAGVFITSIDKNNCATRIWPVSNRNGSFQELKQRNYKRMVVLPLWEFGFAPDGFWVRRIF